MVEVSAARRWGRSDGGGTAAATARRRRRWRRQRGGGGGGGDAAAAALSRVSCALTPAFSSGPSWRLSDKSWILSFCHMSGMASFRPSAAFAPKPKAFHIIAILASPMADEVRSALEVTQNQISWPRKLLNSEDPRGLLSAEREPAHIFWDYRFEGPLFETHFTSLMPRFGHHIGATILLIRICRCFRSRRRGTTESFLL